MVARELAEDYPVTTVCQVLAMPRSSYYYQPVKRDESTLKAAIEEQAGRWPTYGYRRITAELRRAGWKANHKRVARLMGEMGLLVRPTKRKRWTTDSRHNWPRFPNLVLELEVTYPDQVWVGDNEVQLSPTEFRLLRFLALNKGRVMSKGQIVDYVWEYDFDGDPNIVEVYVRRLRQAIDEPFGRHAIETVRGAGYRAVV